MAKPTMCFAMGMSKRFPLSVFFNQKILPISNYGIEMANLTLNGFN